MESKISKAVEELIRTGTIKEKARVICIEAIDRETIDLEPNITKDEVMAIKESVYTIRGVNEFDRWIGIYHNYAGMMHLFGLVFKEYETEAERMLGYLRMWEAYTQEEEHLNTIYQDLVDSGDEDALETLAQSLKHINISGGKLRRDKDGYIEISIDSLYTKIEKQRRAIEGKYANAKAIVMAIDTYARRTGSKGFQPTMMRDSIKDIKGDYAIRVSPRYSRALLLEKESKGMSISEEERRRAVFPCYEEIAPSKETIAYFRKRINNIIKK